MDYVSQSAPHLSLGFVIMFFEVYATNKDKATSPPTRTFNATFMNRSDQK